MKSKNELLVNVRESFQLTTDLIKSEKRVSSLNIGEDFNKSHKDILKKIESIGEILSQSIFNDMFLEGKYLDVKNREQKHYMINRDGFSLLVMGFTGEKALKWKLDYIKWFNFLEREFLIKETTRAKAIIIRKSLTDSVKFHVTDEGNFKKFAYSNYSKLIYKKLFGKDVKRLKEERGLKTADNLRDYLTIEELERVQETESKIAMLIESWKMLDLTDKEIYDKIKEKI